MDEDSLKYADNIIKSNNVYKNAIDMLIDRGYDDDYLIDSCRNITLDIFKKLYKENKLHINVGHKTIENLMAYVYFADEYIQKFKTDNLIKLLERIKKVKQDSETYNIIVILKNKNKTNMKSKAKDYLKYKINVELYQYNKLLFNITKHTLVPQHILIKDVKTKVELLEKFAQTKESDKNKRLIFDLSQIPVIGVNDPVNRWYGGKIGDFYKIIRKKSKSTIKSIFYRRVAEIL